MRHCVGKKGRGCGGGRCWRLEIVGDGELGEEGK